MGCKLGSSWIAGEDRTDGSRVCGNGERCVRECCIDGRGDAKSKMAELAAAVFGLDGGSVGFEDSNKFIDAFEGGHADDWSDVLVRESGGDTFDGGGAGHGGGPWPVKAALVSSTEAWTAKVEEKINRTRLIYGEMACF